MLRVLLSKSVCKEVVCLRAQSTWQRIKMPLKNLLLPSVSLTAAVSLLLVASATAQTYTNLHSFVGGPSDGATPYCFLIASGNTLYGTTADAGSGSGTVFSIQTDGSGFTILHRFDVGAYNQLHYYTNSEGGSPGSGLLLSGNTLYGTAYSGGVSGSGTIYALNTDGTSFRNLYTFTERFWNPWTNSDGVSPEGELVLSGSTLYGTATYGGSAGFGTLFAINTNGTGFTNLHTFTGGLDGRHGSAGLIVSGDTLFGVSSSGGLENKGTIFSLRTDGTGFKNLHIFTGGVRLNEPSSDGAIPYGTLLLSGDKLYGTTGHGGPGGHGTVFALNTDGTGFETLHGFSPLIQDTNSDGADPQVGLALFNNTLYGTAYDGGTSKRGTVFAIRTDGTGFTNLYSFDYNDGCGFGPFAALMVSGNHLYGTTVGGGSSDKGVIFRISFVPQLTILNSGENVILSWPTGVAGFDYAGFNVQSTTSFVPPVVWATNFPEPVTVGGYNTVTNSISGAQKFYRLSQ